MPLLNFLYLLAFLAMDATAQGKLTWLTREYVPPIAQVKVNLPLHWLYPWGYVLLAAANGGLRYDHGWHVGLEVWAIAGALRLALFDPIVNTAKGAPLFALGSSALTDRLLGWAGPVANAAVRVAALGWCGWLLFR